MSQQTLLVKDLPADFDEQKIENFFKRRIQSGEPRAIIDKVGHVYDHLQDEPVTKRAVVSFTSSKYFDAAMKLTKDERTCGENQVLQLDSGFLQLTTLYEPPPGETANLDIVMIHGLTGQAWNTFVKTTKEGSRSREHNWIRDDMPRKFQTVGVYPRIMTYGYNADVFGDPVVGGVTGPATRLAGLLGRREDSNRPLLFICHSLGGIVAKKAISKMVIDQARSVRCCMLFGVPNKGSALANVLSKVPSLGILERGKTNLLKERSLALIAIAQDFKEIRKRHSFPVVCFYEGKKTKSRSGLVKHLVVDRDSATVDPRHPEIDPEPMQIEHTHSDMVKSGSDDITGLLCFYAEKAIQPLVDEQVSEPISVQDSPSVESENPEEAFSGGTRVSRIQEDQTAPSVMPFLRAPPSHGIERPVEDFQAPALGGAQTFPSATSPSNLNGRQNQTQSPQIVNNHNYQPNLTQANAPIINNQTGNFDFRTDKFKVNYSHQDRYMSSVFVGRDQDLKNIESHFFPGTEAKSDIATVVIYGLGGMGKSQLAAQYAHQFHSKYDAVFWVDGSNEENFRQGIAELAFLIITDEKAMRLNTEDEVTSYFKAVLSWFNKPQNTRWLLVVDNADMDKGGILDSADVNKTDVLETTRFYRLENILPSPPHGNIIITTRDGSLPRRLRNCYPHKLNPIQTDASIELLQKKSQISSLDAKTGGGLRQIAEKLEGLPLALAQAGSILGRGLSADEFLDSWDKEWENLGTMDSEDNRNILTVWKIAFDRLSRESSTAAKFLQLSSYLDGRRIEDDFLDCSKVPELSREWYFKAFPEWYEELISSKLKFKTTISLLADYSLIERLPTADATSNLKPSAAQSSTTIGRTANGGSFSVHSVVHHWCYHEIEDTARQEFCRTASILVRKSYSGAESSDNWSYSQLLLPHCNRIFQTLQDQLPKFKGLASYDDAWRWAFIAMGQIHRAVGQFEQSGQLYLRVLPADVIHLESKAPMHLFFKAPDATNDLVGINHKFTNGQGRRNSTLDTISLSAVGDLSILYQIKSKSDQGKILLEWAIPKNIASGKMSGDVSEILTLKTQLARCYIDSKEFAQARGILNDVIEAWESKGSPKAEYAVQAFFYLGDLESREKNQQGAIDAYTRAANIREDMYPHPNIPWLGCLILLGQACFDGEEMKDAEKHLRKAWDGIKEVENANPSFEAMLSGLLGNLYGRMRPANYELSISFYQCAMESYGKMNQPLREPLRWIPRQFKTLLRELKDQTRLDKLLAQLEELGEPL